MMPRMRPSIAGKGVRPRHDGFSRRNGRLAIGQDTLRDYQTGNFSLLLSTRAPDSEKTKKGRKNVLVRGERKI